MKNIISKIFGPAIAAVALCLLPAAMMQSCTAADGVDGEPYFRLKGAKDIYEYNAKEHSVTMEIYSNMGLWTVEPEFAEDVEWIDIWPFQGTDDGRFTIKIFKNETAFTRFANINVVIAGKVVTSFRVSQEASDPYLMLGLGGTTMTSPSAASELTIPLNTNIGWRAELVEPTPWIEFGDETETSQTIHVKENTGAAERMADIKFTAIGTGLEGLNVTVTVKQFDKSKDPYNGEAKTVAEIMEVLGNAPGRIAQNYYVDVFVTSDKDNLNVLPNHMFVQDGSGRGMLLEFSSASDNIFPLNSKIKVHLYDSEFIVSDEPEDFVGRGLKLVNFAGNQVFENNGVDPEGAEPVVVDDLNDLYANLDRYENTLVKLPKVEFCMPFGCYVNIDEGNAKSAVYNPVIDDVNDGPNLYGHLLRDTSGRVIKLMSRRNFLQRFSETMPFGAGDITGIVTKYPKVTQDPACIFIRNTDDNNVSDNEQDRITNTLVNIGPLVDRPDLPKIMATTGMAQLKTSCYEAVVQQSGAAIQYAYTYSRREPGTITVNPVTGEQVASPVLVNTPMETAMRYQYTCYNQATFWNFAGSTINRTGLDPDDKHEAWILNVEQFSATGKDIYFMFTISGSYRAPQEFVLEWAENESDPVAAYNAIENFTSPYWSYSFQLQQYSIKLPDELKNKEKFTLRLRGTGTAGAGGADINNTAAVRTGLFKIVEMK